MTYRFDLDQSCLTCKIRDLGHEYDNPIKSKTK
jgi:hypothetical protein